MNTKHDVFIAMKGGGEGEVTHLEFWGEGRGYIRKGNYMACIINSLNEGG